MRPLWLFLLSFLLLAQFSVAETIGPVIYEQKDIGDIGLKEFVYSLSADCTAGTITSIVMNESYLPESDANTYIKYVDFSSQLISNVKTDSEGVSLHKLPGNVKLMRGLFILVIEKHGFRNKEVHFDLSPCYSNATNTKPPKPQNQTTGNNSQNGTTNPGTPQNNQTNLNQTDPHNQTNASGNQTGDNPQPGQNPGASLCPTAALLSVLASVGGLIALKNKSRARPWARSRYKPFKGLP